MSTLGSRVAATFVKKAGPGLLKAIGAAFKRPPVSAQQIAGAANKLPMTAGQIGRRAATGAGAATAIAAGTAGVNQMLQGSSVADALKYTGNVLYQGTPVATYLDILNGRSVGMSPFSSERSVPASPLARPGQPFRLPTGEPELSYRDASMLQDHNLMYGTPFNRKELVNRYRRLNQYRFYGDVPTDEQIDRHLGGDLPVDPQPDAALPVNPQPDAALPVKPE
jgi:hypothetical protein